MNDDKQIASFGPMPADKYHAAKDSISKGMLSTFRKSRREFEGQYVLKNAPARKPTAAMNVGTLTHSDVLEPAGACCSFVLIPDDLLSGPNKAIASKEAKDWVAAAERQGKTPMKRQEFDRVACACDAIRDVCGHWIELPSRREHAIFWSDSHTPLTLRCRPDWLIETPDRAIVLDLKTTADANPATFQRVIENCGYWLQQAHYTEGIELATGLPVDWYFIVAQNDYPFTCSICALGAETMHAARLERRRLLNDLAECFRTNDFSETWEQPRINLIECRPWTIRNEREEHGRGNSDLHSENIIDEPEGGA